MNSSINLEFEDPIEEVGTDMEEENWSPGAGTARHDFTDMNNDKVHGADSIKSE